MDEDTSSRDAQELADLGRVVRDLREQRGLSERELAHSVRGMSPAGIRAIEAGTPWRSLDYERLLRLANALGVEPGALFRRAGKPSGSRAREPQD